LFFLLTALSDAEPIGDLRDIWREIDSTGGAAATAALAAAASDADPTAPPSLTTETRLTKAVFARHFRAAGFAAQTQALWWDHFISRLWSALVPKPHYWYLDVNAYANLMFLTLPLPPTSTSDEQQQPQDAAAASSALSHIASTYALLQMLPTTAPPSRERASHAVIDRARFVFAVYDFDGDGFIGVRDVARAFELQLDRNLVADWEPICKVVLSRMKPYAEWEEKYGSGGAVGAGLSFSSTNASYKLGSSSAASVPAPPPPPPVPRVSFAEFMSLHPKKTEYALTLLFPRLFYEPYKAAILANKPQSMQALAQAQAQQAQAHAHAQAQARAAVSGGAAAAAPGRGGGTAALRFASVAQAVSAAAAAAGTRGASQKPHTSKSASFSAVCSLMLWCLTTMCFAVCKQSCAPA
jgi:hypothetical protein